MENVKYAEFTGKVVEIDKKLDAAVKEIDDAIKTIREMVKDMPRSEIMVWAKKASDDGRVSPQVYHLVLLIASDEIHKRVTDVMDILYKL